MMGPRTRRALLTVHIVTSVGWLGAVAAFLALAIVGLRGVNVYVAMAIVTQWVIVPSCLAALVSGILGSVLTPWGLVRHYWVAFKLVLTAASTVLLFVHAPSVRYAAALAAGGASGVALRDVDGQLVFDGGAALVVLVISTVLSVYKPVGVTRAAGG